MTKVPLGGQQGREARQVRVPGTVVHGGRSSEGNEQGCEAKVAEAPHDVSE